MPEPIDVYRDWLGITETARPLSHYQLLRVKPFEDDTAKIRTHYRKMNAHVRKFASGDYAQQSQELLNELARAMLCLTDLKRKREYDASLGREEEVEGRRRSLEEILLARKVIDQAQLTKARNYANAVGLETRDALIQQKMATPEVVTLAYAESLGLPYIELEDIGVDERLASQVPATVARQHACVPVMADEGQLLMAAPAPLSPEVEEELRLRLDMPVRTVLCTAASINAAVAKHYPRDAGEPPQAAGAPAKSSPAKTEETEVLSPQDKLKQRGFVALIAFNIVVILVMFLLWISYSGPWAEFPTMKYASLSVFVGLLVGGAVFGALHFLDIP
jgi:hypothetical protein